MATSKTVISSLRTIFPNHKEKEIMGAMISVAYTDGRFDQIAILPDAEYDFNISLVTDLLHHGATALLECYSELPSAIKKLEGIIA